MGKHYKEDFKIMVVKEYLGGLGSAEILLKYDLEKSRLSQWTRQYRETGRCEDRTGKSLKRGKPSGRPKRIRTEEMNTEQYIKHLEMENEILKTLSSLSSKEQK